jgi:hypothetical protein
MAGKRAKCSCGQVIDIPTFPTQQPAADDWLSQNLGSPTAFAGADSAPFGGSQSPASGSSGPSGAGPILFQSEYGIIRPWVYGLIAFWVIISLAAILAGLFWNRGWVVNNVRLSPLVATVLFELVGCSLLLLIVWFLSGYFIHLKHPQRVAVTASGVIVPAGHWSTAERFVRWTDMSAVFMSYGPIRQLQLKQGLRNVKVLVSLQFPTDDAFDRILGHARQHGKLD